MSKKKRYKYAIGFDECLNGFKVRDRHYPFMVMVGYLGKDGRPYGSHAFGSKKNRNFLGKRPSDLEEVLRCARPFLESHQDYYYVVIPEKRIKDPGESYRRKAEGVALITKKFFEENRNLNQDNTVLYIDETDGKINSSYLNIILSYLIEKEIFSQIYHESKTKGELSKQVIKTADMIAYYLASIRLISKSKSWPHRSRRLHPGNPLGNLQLN